MVAPVGIKPHARIGITDFTAVIFIPEGIDADLQFDRRRQVNRLVPLLRQRTAVGARFRWPML